jgi:hypothetical protein
MNYAQELLQLEEQKKQLLEKSQQATFSYYYCFVNIEPINFYSSKLPKGVKRYGIRLSFEILAFDKKASSQVYSIDFDTTLELKKSVDNLEKLECRDSCFSTKKAINEAGIFFINNYNELKDKQKVDFISKIDSFYNKLQDSEDARAIPAIKTRNLVGYVKEKNINLTLNDFAKIISKTVDNIVEQHLFSFIIEKTEKYFEKSEKSYQLTEQDKKEVVKDIKSKLISSVNNIIASERKIESSQAEWIKLQNEVTKFFKENDNKVASKSKAKPNKVI